MAELTTAETTANSCCAPEAQATCCEPSAKAECCAATARAAAARPAPARRKPATCASRCASATPPPPYRSRAPTPAPAAAPRARPSTAAARSSAPRSTRLGDREQLPDTARLASLGCGNPTAVAELHEGETVLDLGSGGGIDVLLSAKRVGPTGKAHGLDMTDEMLALARENARKAGVENVEFHKGYIEAIPLPDASVDVVISNCVINLSGDKPKVLREVARVLRPGGRFAVSDVIADEDMDDATRADMQAYTGCIAGALTERSSSGRSQMPASLTSRSARPTACTSRQPRRSSMPASRASLRHERGDARGSSARPADALPALGGKPVESVGDRPVRRQRAVAGDGGPIARVVRARVR